MRIQAKTLCGEHIGKSITYVYQRYDYGSRTWYYDTRTSPVAMITHKKNLGVNVRVGTSEGFPHQGEAQFRPDEWVDIS